LWGTLSFEKIEISKPCSNLVKIANPTIACNDLSFYAERHPIPQVATHEISDDGSIGAEKGHTSKVGIIREVDSTVVLDIATAEGVIKWLQGRVKEIKKIHEKEKNSSN